MSVFAVDKLMAQTRKLAAAYRLMTGQPLPVRAEIAHYNAASLLGLKLVPLAPGGFDVVGLEGEREGIRYQVKGRTIFGKVMADVGDCKRGAMPVACFCHPAQLVWCCEERAVTEQEVWEYNPDL